MTVLKANALSVSSLENLKKDLKAYRDSLEFKMTAFVNELLDIGIETAQQNLNASGTFGTHQMAQLGNVSFRKEVETSDGVVYGIMFGHGGDVVGNWYVSDGNGVYTPKSDTINSLLAIEFGTAGKALSAREMFGAYGGQGTMSSAGHANDNAWYIVTGIDEKGHPNKWVMATAIKPTRPMFKAGLQMYVEVKKAAENAFRG